MDDARAVLQKADLQLTMIGTLYEADLDLQRVSPTLRAKISTFLNNERAALDVLAEQLVAILGAGEAHTHYPLAPDADRFEASIDKNMPGVRESRPDVADVVARHQPFCVPALAQLRHLLLDEAQQRLSPDTRPAPPEVEPPIPPPGEPPPPPVPPPVPGGLGAGLTGPLYINGVEYDPQKLQRINAPPASRRETIYVEWHFEGADTSARHTLEAIHTAVSAAVDEISAAAGLGSR
jgi:hypothetical protein